MSVATAVPEELSTSRERVGWYAYDFANSAFSTTVVTVFLGPYLGSVADKAADANGNVDVLGVTVAAGSLFPYTVSLSVFLTVFVLPVVGAVADRSSRKKQLLALFSYVGAGATVGLLVLTDGFRQLWHTLRGLKAYPLTLFFLIAYLVYNDGIQTVISLASVYADKQLGLSQSVQVGTILLVQFLAFGGAWGLGWLSRRIGAWKTVLGSLVVWTAA